MKKFIVFLVAVGLVLYGASPLFAGGAVSKNNLSAEYIRTLNRTAATDSADIVAYNPAGVVKLEDGLTVNFSFHTFGKDYKNITGGTTYESDEPSTIPALYTVYKKGQWAGFFGFNVPLGGGYVNYPTGNATTLKIQNSYGAGGTGPMKLEGESYGLGYTFGGAYQINDMVSVSVAARYIDSKKWFNGTALATLLGGQATAEYDATASGWGAVFGVDVFVNKDLTLGFKYETKTALEYTYVWAAGTNTPGGNVLNQFEFRNGGKANEDLPAMFSAGVSYNITPVLKIMPTLTYYFQKDADLGGIGVNSKTLEDRISDGYDLGIALEYAFTKTVKGSLGYLYTETGVAANDMLPEAPELDARTIGAGVVWQVIPKLDLNFGIGKVNYKDDTSGPAPAFFPNVTYEKDITFLAFGIQYKFF